MVASSFVCPRFFRVLITTKYVESRVEKPVMPIIVGTWPTAMLRAEPVINADMAVNEMKSTIHPQRTSPMKQMMLPAITARADATT